MKYIHFSNALNFKVNPVRMKYILKVIQQKIPSLLKWQEKVSVAFLQ